MLIYSNTINMAVERLGDTLATRIGSAMSTVAASMKEMTAAFEKQQRRLQVHSSEDTCMVGALASRPCSLWKVRHLCRLEGLHPHIPVQRGVLLMILKIMVANLHRNLPSLCQDVQLIPWKNRVPGETYTYRL